MPAFAQHPKTQGLEGSRQEQKGLDDDENWRERASGMYDYRRIEWLVDAV